MPLATSSEVHHHGQETSGETPSQDQKVMKNIWQRAHQIEENVIVQTNLEGKLEYLCGFCQVPFSKRFNLKRHIERRHLKF